MLWHINAQLPPEIQGVGEDTAAGGAAVVTVSGAVVPPGLLAVHGTSVVIAGSVGSAKELSGFMDYFSKSKHGTGKKGTVFRGGSKKSRDGYINSKPKEFRKWFERFYKDKKFPNSSNEKIDEAFDEWNRMGRPFPK